MKKIITATLLLAIGAFTASFVGDTIATETKFDFIQNDYQQAKEQAKENDQLIFVDTYTSWCGWCKRMDQTTFQDENAAAFFNKNFVNLKMNMEKGDGPALARKLKIQAYPTFVILDKDGNLVGKAVGYQTVDNLVAFGKKHLAGKSL